MSYTGRSNISVFKASLFSGSSDVVEFFFLFWSVDLLFDGESVDESIGKKMIEYTELY